MKPLKELSSVEICLEYGIDVVDRRLYISGPITEESVGIILKGLRILDKSPGPITIVVNSSGGLNSGMYALYDAIRACEQTVVTLGIGEVCSAAGLILVAGDKRYATNNCWFMAHEGSIEVEETSVITLASKAAMEVRNNAKWAELMAKHTGKDKRWWMKHGVEDKKELWLDAQEMKAHGIIDDIWPGEI